MKQEVKLQFWKSENGTSEWTIYYKDILVEQTSKGYAACINGKDFLFNTIDELHDWFEIQNRPGEFHEE